jgi:hypothetical protein
MKRSGMPRRTRLSSGSGLTRSSRIARKARIKASNPARRKSEWQRCYGSKERVAWVKSRPSVASGKGPCVNAHTRSDGAGRKADACWIVPLTDAEHRELHRIGVASFEARYGINLEFMAAQTAMAYADHLNRNAA